MRLGRRDSLKASFDGANKFIPAPNSSLDTLIENFSQRGLDEGDLVALSGKVSRLSLSSRMKCLLLEKMGNRLFLIILSNQQIHINYSYKEVDYVIAKIV